MPREHHGIAARIFLWFWITALCALVTLPLFALLSSREALFPLLQQADGDLAGTQARTAIRAYRRGETSATAEFTDAMRAAHLRGCIVDGTGRPLPGLACDELELRLASRVLVARRTVRNPLAPRYLVGRILTLGGRSYALVASPDMPPYRHILLALLRLVMVLIIVSAFCYAGAVALAKPFENLRLAARKMAQGDLSARVGPGGRVREVVELGADFDHMADTVQALVETQKRLVRDTSHELRSPLARMRVAVELARKNGPARESALNRIELEIGRMDELLSQMLELARMESDSNVGLQSVELAAFLAPIVEDARFEAAKDEKAISFDGAASAQAAPDLLARAFENIVRNAIRYTPSRTAINVGIEVRGHQVAIVVRDHGPGVPETELESIFRPFHRVDSDRDRKTGGHGLGLAIARRAVALCGGSLTARNAGPGLLVEILLPGKAV